MRGENRKDRKKDVALRAGRRRLAEGETDPRTERTRAAIAAAGEAIVRDERAWPTLAAVRARTGFSEARVGRNSSALGPARRLYLGIVGPYPGWTDPLGADAGSPAEGPSPQGDAGDGPTAGAAQPNGAPTSEVSAPDASGTGQAGQTPDGGADPVDGGLASREAGLEAALKLTELRLDRVERELRAERLAHHATRRELATAELVRDRVLSFMRPPVKEYKPLSDDMEFREAEDDTED